jgi:5-hydroxyisourate hydrolase
MTMSTHVLDAAAGVPAAGLPVRLERHDGDGWTTVRECTTDADGRVSDLATELVVGDYRVVFDIVALRGPETFYPEVVVTVRVKDPSAHHHVPLLLSPFAYTTYRGS